jgi:hypothetical protein
MCDIGARAVLHRVGSLLIGRGLGGKSGDVKKNYNLKGAAVACAQDPTRRPGRLIVIELRPCNRTDDFVVIIARIYRGRYRGYRSRKEGKAMGKAVRQWAQAVRQCRYYA